MDPWLIPLIAWSTFFVWRVFDDWKKPPKACG